MTEDTRPTEDLRSISRWGSGASTTRRRAGLVLCLASTPGGHLTELEGLTEGVAGHESFLVTVKTEQSESVMKQVPKRFVRRIERNPANLLINSFQALRILLRERPDAIISTGAGDVVPLMVIGSALGIPTVFVESVARVQKPSLTGRIVSPFAALVLIPWAALANAYPRAVHIRAFAHPTQLAQTLRSSPKILILTGTGPRGFNRLLQAIDQLVAAGALSNLVLAQTGESTYVPKYYEHRRYLPHSELTKAISESDLIVTHDGAGSIAESISAGKPTLVVPRRAEQGELMYKSDAPLARHLASLEWVLVVDNPAKIPEAIAELSFLHPKSLPDSGRAPHEVLHEFLASIVTERTTTQQSRHQ